MVKSHIPASSLTVGFPQTEPPRQEKPKRAYIITEKVKVFFS